MNFLDLRPVLWVPNLRAATDWYTKMLDFRLESSDPDGSWTIVANGSVHILLSVPNAHIPYAGPNFSGSFYIATDDVEGWWQRLRHLPDIVYPIETFPWQMREFAIRDLNGFMIQIGQSVADASPDL